MFRVVSDEPSFSILRVEVSEVGRWTSYVGWMVDRVAVSCGKRGEERREEMELTGSFAKCNCQRGRVARRSAGTKLL